MAVAAPKGKEVAGEIKLQIAAGKTPPVPPVGPALGQHGVNIMDFCKAFNAKTSAKEMEGLVIPVVITVYGDRSYAFVTKTTPATKVGTVTEKQVEEIARTKLPDLNAASVEAAIRSIRGTARSMGIDV